MEVTKQQGPINLVTSAKVTTTTTTTTRTSNECTKGFVNKPEVEQSETNTSRPAPIGQSQEVPAICPPSADQHST